MRAWQSFTGPVPDLPRLSVDEQRAYDAYCDAVVDASEAEIARTGVTYTLDEVFEQAHAEIERLKREYPREDLGRPCSQ